MITEEEYLEYREMIMAWSKVQCNEYIKRMKPVWRKVGEKLRRMREGLRISRHAIAETIGAADSVIMRLEKGEVIRRRPVIEQSFKMAVELIQYKRREAAGLM